MRQGINYVQTVIILMEWRCVLPSDTKLVYLAKTNLSEFFVAFKKKKEKLQTDLYTLTEASCQADSILFPG